MFCVFDSAFLNGFDFQIQFCHSTANAQEHTSHHSKCTPYQYNKVTDFNGYKLYIMHQCCILRALFEKSDKVELNVCKGQVRTGWHVPKFDLPINLWQRPPSPISQISTGPLQKQNAWSAMTSQFSSLWFASWWCHYDTTQHQMAGWLWIMNWDGFGWKWPWPNGDTTLVFDKMDHDKTTNFPTIHDVTQRMHKTKLHPYVP